MCGGNTIADESVPFEESDTYLTRQRLEERLTEVS